MSWTEGELSALRTAYASGTTRVTYDGKTIEYDTGDALLARIRLIERDMAAVSGRPRRRVGFASFSRD